MRTKTRSTATSLRAHRVVQDFAKTSRTYSNQDWERSLQRLTQALCRDAVPGRISVPEHQELQAVVPFYTAAQVQGAPVQEIYPALFEHLQVCPDCRTLCKTLSTNPTKDFHAPPKPADAVSMPASLAWKRTFRPSEGTYTFKFSPKYIRSVWSPPAASQPLRSTGKTSDTLVISEMLQHRESLIPFSAWLEPARGKRTRQIRLRMGRFTGNPTVRLQWNGKARTPVQVKNDLIFEDLPPPRTGTFAFDISFPPKKRAR